MDRTLPTHTGIYKCPFFSARVVNYWVSKVVNILIDIYTNHNELQLVSKLNPNITHGTRKREDEFEFNKDAGDVRL
jgi:hypothetical protein